MVCGIIDATSKDSTITVKYLNPSRSIRNRNEITRNPNIGSGVGSSKNPHATPKPELINAKLEARKGDLFRGVHRGRMH